MRYLIITCMFILFSKAAGYDYWNYIRYSALLPGEEIEIRVENPTGSSVENSIIYSNNGISEEPMMLINDGPSTLSATVPGPVQDVRNYGFRLLDAVGKLHLFPVLIQEGSDPEPDDLTFFVTDPAGDEPFGYSNLDLVECRFSFSDSELFVSLKNTGGGFPVNSGLTFFGYLFAITDPEEIAPDTVLALLYTVTQGGIISPGLYKITGTGFGDLEKIGEIQSQLFPAVNSILLSCEISDLMADDYFSSWFNESDQTIAAAAFTQKITILGGAEQSDLTSGGSCYLRQLSIEPAVNQYPQISDPAFSGSGAQASASLNYLDLNGNCPVISEVQFDEGTTYPMYPANLDYSSTVLYETEEGIDPLSSGAWNTALFRFSDDMIHYTELEAYNTAGINGSEFNGSPGISAYPNPFSAVTEIQFSIPDAGHATLTVFDLNGRIVNVIAEGTFSAGIHTLNWVPDGVSSGCYLVRLTSADEFATANLVFIR